MTAPKTPAKSKGGRPTDYSEDVSVEFCSRIAIGRSLRSVVLDDDMPSHTTVYRWFAKYPEFCAQYARAKEDSADSRAEQIEDIGDKVLTGEYEPNAARVAIDAFKWISGKHKPKKYGDKQQVEHSGGVTVDDSVSDEERAERIAAILERARNRRAGSANEE